MKIAECMRCNAWPYGTWWIGSIGAMVTSLAATLTCPQKHESLEPSEETSIQLLES